MTPSIFPELYDTLPPLATQRGADPTLLFDEILSEIRTAITDDPRSRQRRPGPSTLGSPCARRIGYHFAETDPVNTDPDAWKPTVGKAVHAWLEETFRFVNARLDPDNPRFLLEFALDVGEAGGKAITGRCDVYDRVTCAAIDWKILGDASLKRYRQANHPGEQYRTQLHLYGRGWQRRGLPVDTVHVIALPQNANLRNAWHWHEPYDETVAATALTRADAIANLVDSFGAAALPVLPTAQSWCTYCPFYLPASTDVTQACPGHPAEVNIPIPA